MIILAPGKESQKIISDSNSPYYRRDKINPNHNILISLIYTGTTPNGILSSVSLFRVEACQYILTGTH